MADKLVEDDLIRQGYFIYFLANASFPGDPGIEAELQKIKALMAPRKDGG